MGGDASSVKLNLTDPCRTVPRLRDARPAGWVTYCMQYMSEYNAENSKQGRKRFNSIVKTITLPIFLLFIYGGRAGLVSWRKSSLTAYGNL